MCTFRVPESQTKKTREQIAREKTGGLGRVKSILAASTRQDWEAHGSRLWVHKGATKLKIVDLTDDEGRVEPQEEEDGRLVVAGWHYDLCRVISAGEYLGAYPVRSYLRRAGIAVI